MAPANSVRYIVFKEDGTWHAIALEFNIVESGDDLQETLLSLFDAVDGYAASAAANGLGESVLNQSAPEEYERLWRTLQARDSRPPPCPTFAYGRMQVGESPKNSS